MIAPIKKPTLWDRVKTAKRVLFNQAHGYDAAKNTRNRGRRQDTQVRAEHFALDMNDRQRVISTLLDFRRNNPVVSSICRLRENDVVGPGLMPQAHSGREDLDMQLESLWKTWSRHPEVTRTMNMRELQQQLASLPLIFGDGGLLLTKNGQVQLIEGDRIGTEGGGNTIIRRRTNGESDELTTRKRIIDGVEVNKQGMPLAYHIGAREDGTLREVRRIRTQDFIFHKKRIRPSQIRGVPELATVANSLQDLDEYDEIEMISAKVAASLSAVVKREGAMDFELANRANDDEDERLENMFPGQIQYLEQY